MFQLTVNFTAVGLITICSLLGLDSPFTSVQLLWLNLIMDGPPALSLAMEGVREEYMKNPPVKRSAGIVNKRVMAKILLNSLLIGVVVFFQYEKNFLGVEISKVKTSAFALFTFLQIFNSFNCKELGIESIFHKLFSNKLMVWSMALTLGLQIIFTELVGGFMGTPLGARVWLKITGVSLSIIMFSELYKFTLRLFRGNIQNLQKNSLNRPVKKGAK
jgi:Ca2+-transporting ATPase